MAYNKKNYYKKIQDIQELYIRMSYRNKLIKKEIYWQYIEPKYRISYRTFQTYLGVNAKKELRILKENTTK